MSLAVFVDTPVLGDFQESECGKWFSYSPTLNEWALAHGYVHEIHVLDGVRFACVRKTRAKVVVDEAADGSPIVEQWLIKNHSVFS